MPARGHERRDANFPEAVYNIPVSEHADDVKLARTIHRNLRILRVFMLSILRLRHAENLQGENKPAKIAGF
jgi:hypothetical protein